MFCFYTFSFDQISLKLEPFTTRALDTHMHARMHARVHTHSHSHSHTHTHTHTHTSIHVHVSSIYLYMCSTSEMNGILTTIVHINTVHVPAWWHVWVSLLLWWCFQVRFWLKLVCTVASLSIRLRRKETREQTEEAYSAVHVEVVME